MSFPKAKRFIYKNPEDNISPADFNIATNLDKGYHFPKCPRFNQKQTDDDMSNSVCSRYNCCRDISSNCSTPNQQRSRSSSINFKEKFMDFLRSDFNRASSSKKKCMDFVRADSERPHTSKDNKSNKRVTEKNGGVRNAMSGFEKHRNMFDSEEFIDDDYHSYTSSEEIGSLKKLDEFEFKEVCDALKKLQVDASEEKRDTNFEKLVLLKIDNIEKNLASFQSNFAKFSEQMLMEKQEQRRQEKGKARMEKAQTRSCQSSLPQDKYNGIKEIIEKGITQLRNDFEAKQKAMIANSEKKISNVIAEMHANGTSDTSQTKVLCKKSVSDLTEKLVDLLNDQPAWDLATACRLEEEADEFEEPQKIEFEWFDYENVCEVLSGHLQDSKDELESLEQDRMDITLKYSDTQQTLEEQASIISRLHNELATIKSGLTEDD